MDVTGIRFGRLVALSVIKNRNHKYTWNSWRCRCDCGQFSNVRISDLMDHTKSCGCLRVEKVSENFTTHGHTSKGNVSREYRTWCSMKERCDNPKNKRYQDYGARGISICKRWRTSFQAFLDDMGSKPPGMTLERKNTNGNYEPSNCTWADNFAQSNNRRNNRRVIHEGQSLTVSQLARKLGVKYSTVYMPLYRQQQHA
jgi:hypothetical protein